MDHAASATAASAAAATPASTAAAVELGRALAEQVGRVIVGKADQTRLVTVALLADGHVLLDDVPGVAKTLPIDKSSIAFGFIFAIIFLRERPNWQSITAAALVLIALAVTLIPDKKAPALLPPLTTQSITPAAK